jgi:CubicO group peptidase (beta-lactamase class C family)
VHVTTPSEQGVAPEGIAAFLDAVEGDPRIEPHGLIVQRHGHRIVEGYWAPHTGDRSRLLYSLSKTFTGTALALLLGEGRLSLDDLVSEHLPHLLEDADPATRRMKIRHIASMSTGHDHDTVLEALGLDPEDPVRGFFKIPPDAEPGTLFAYNQPPVLALATILRGLAGERLVDYLRPRVLDPLGIGHLSWSTIGDVEMGFSGVHTNLDAVARLGQLYLDDGVWEGRRLLPEGWVAAASSPQIANPQWDQPDWQQGYGFQLWMSRHGYRGDGAFGQFMVVLPEHDAVVALFSCVEDMQVVLDLLWEHLLPAMDDASSPPTEDDDALARRLARLSLPTVTDRLGGHPPDVEAMTFAPGVMGPTSHRTVVSMETGDGRLVVHEARRSIEVPLRAEWTVVDPTLAACASRLDDGRLVVDLVFLASPHRLEVELDPTTGTFTSRWPVAPLFGGAGVHHRLASIRPPAD